MLHLLGTGFLVFSNAVHASYWRGEVLPYPTDPSQYRDPDVSYTSVRSHLSYPIGPDYDSWPLTTPASFPKNVEVRTFPDPSPPSHKEQVQMGDIKMLKSQFNNLHTNSEDNNREPDPLEAILKWDAYLSNGRYKIAYKIDEASFAPKDLALLKSTLKVVEADFYMKTSIEYGLWGKKDFRHEHFITFTAKSKQGLSGCMSFLGRVGDVTAEPYIPGQGEQEISLARDFCITKNQIIRELVHSLGWLFEHNRPDRDFYLDILWENIPADLQTNFLKLENLNTWGSSYDFDSLMHFSSDHLDFIDASHPQAKSYKGKKWAKSLTGEIPELWQQEQIMDGLSMWDAWEINMAYNLRHHCEQQGGLWKFWDRRQQQPKLNFTYTEANTCDTDFPGNGYIRLVGDNDFSGRIEIFRDKQWGTICEHEFDDVAASVVCRDLGFMHGRMLAKDKVKPGVGKIWLDDVRCSGDEETFNQCSFVEFLGPGNCIHSQDVGITCSNSRVRLIGTENENEGLVEYFDTDRQAWGGVCSRGFGKVDAVVVCKELNFDGGRVTEYLDGYDQPEFWFKGVRCDGSESSISECGAKLRKRCRRGHQVAVRCGMRNVRLISPQGKSIWSALDSGAAVMGRVEVYKNNEWGTICERGFDEKEALLVCDALGYKNGLVVAPEKVPSGIDKIWLNELECTGSESSLLDCRSDSIQNCTHHQDVGVRCANTRILPDSNILQAYRNNEWRSVCASTTVSETEPRFDWKSAEVACRELGFSKFNNYTIGIKGELSTFNRCTTTTKCSGEDGREQVCKTSETCGDVHLASVRECTTVKLCGNYAEGCSLKTRCKTMPEYKYNQENNINSRTILAGRKPFWMTKLKCNGEEKSLFSCGVSQKSASKCWEVQLNCS